MTLDDSERPACLADHGDPWINLSQPLYNGMPAWGAPSDVRFWVDEHRWQIEGREAVMRVTHIQMTAHVGTHIDAARHFFPDARAIDEYPQEAFVGSGVVLDVRREGVVPLTAEELAAASPEIREGDFVLLWFGYAERFRDPLDYREHPYLATDAADWLVDRRVQLVGVDTITPDLPGSRRSEGFDFPVHRRLLGHDVLIIENLGAGLACLASRRVEVRALPLAIEGGDAAPVVPQARLVE